MNQFKIQNSKFKINLSPAEVILERSRAFERGDYGYIFDTFHSGSNFRRQFATRTEYIAYAHESLGCDFRILDCEVLQNDLCDEEARVIFVLEMEFGGAPQKFAELAWLRYEAGAWRYHRGLKITGEELPENPGALCFADFAKLDQRLVF